MHLSPYLKRQCLDVLEKINARPISKIFLYPVDPLQDNLPDYFEIVKNPMDLGTIKRNLRANKYRTVQEWKQDMELVWSNSILFHSENSAVGMMALELKNYYLELTKYISDSYRSAWKYQLIELHQEFQTCVKEINKFRAAPAPKSRQIVKRDQLLPMLEELPPAQFRRHYNCFSAEEIEKLANDINAIKDVQQIQKITLMVKQRDPNLVDENAEQITLDINSLQPALLQSIRDKIDQYRNIENKET